MATYDRRNDVVTLFYPFRKGKHAVTTVFFPWKAVEGPSARFRVRQRYGFSEAELQLGEKKFLPPDPKDQPFVKQDFMRRTELEQLRHELFEKERVVVYPASRAFTATRDPRDPKGKITATFGRFAEERAAYELVREELGLALDVMPPLERAREILFEEDPIKNPESFHYRVRQRLGFTETELHFGNSFLPNPKRPDGVFQKPDFIRKTELQALRHELVEEGKIFYESSSRTFTASLDPRDPDGKVEVRFCHRRIPDAFYFVTKAEIDLVLKVMPFLEEVWGKCYRCLKDTSVLEDSESFSEDVPVDAAVSGDNGRDDEEPTASAEEAMV